MTNKKKRKRVASSGGYNYDESIRQETGKLMSYKKLTHDEGRCIRVECPFCAAEKQNENK